MLPQARTLERAPSRALVEPTNDGEPATVSAARRWPAIHRRPKTLSGPRRLGVRGPSAGRAPRGRGTIDRGQAAGRKIGSHPAPSRAMLMRHATALTAANYVEPTARKDIERPPCPFHPHGRCRLTGAAVSRESPASPRRKSAQCVSSSALRDSSSGAKSPPRHSPKGRPSWQRPTPCAGSRRDYRFGAKTRQRESEMRLP